MTDSAETIIDLPQDTVTFCNHPWKVPALALVCLVALTFVWGFYILETYRDSDQFENFDDYSVTEFLFQNIAAPDIQRLYDAVSPAVVGIGDGGVNGGAIGSGAIVSASGYILTTLHAVTGIPEITIQVKTATGIRRYEAQVVKSLPAHDLVLLKMRTSDRFLHFLLGDAAGLRVGQPIHGFGQERSGHPVVKRGAVLGVNRSLTAGGMPISHLIETDSIYSWVQNGGPLVNDRGELIAIGLAVQGATGSVEGFGVPSNVIAAHFQDVVDFKLAEGVAAAGSADGIISIPADAPGSGPSRPVNTGSAAWWAKARAQVELPERSFGVNVAMGTGAPAVASAGTAVDREHLLQGRFAGFRIGDILGLALLALAAGIVGGMMTMGGGLIQVAGMMAIFGYGMYLIRPVAYLTNVFVYGAAAIRYNRDRLILWGDVKALGPWAVFGVVTGYFIGNAIGDDAVAILLGIFALFMVAKGLHEIFAERPDEILVRTAPELSASKASVESVLDELLDNRKGESRPPTFGDHSKNAMLGMPMGLISGVLGISGGVVEVPLQRFLGGRSLHNAIANSSVLVFWASVGGALVSFVHGINNGLIEWHTPLTLATFMVPGAYVGGVLGARLTKVLPVVALKWIYTAIMAAISVKMLFIG